MRVNINSEIVQLICNIYQDYVSANNSLPDLNKMIEIVKKNTKKDIKQYTVKTVLKKYNLKTQINVGHEKKLIFLIQEIVKENKKMTANDILTELQTKIKRQITKARLYQLLNLAKVNYIRKQKPKHITKETMIEIVGKVQDLKNKQQLQKKENRITMKQICEIVMSSYPEFDKNAKSSLYSTYNVQKHKLIKSL